MSLNHAVPQHVSEPALQQGLSSRNMLKAFQRFLPPQKGGEWRRCDLERVRVRPEKSPQILYRLYCRDDWSQAPEFFFAEFHPAASALDRFLQLRRRGGDTAPTGYVAELHMIYWRFPADPRLAQLPGLYDEGQWKVLSYVPMTTCVLAGDVGGQEAVLKLYHDDRVEGLGRVLESLSRAGLSVPHLLYADSARRLLALEYLPGRLFWKDARKNLRQEVIGAMARELAALHATTLPSEVASLLPHKDHAAVELARLERTVPELIDAYPALEARFLDLWDRLRHAPRAAQNNLLHGDFHPGQFLIHHGTPRLIDFDTLCHGDPMYDLARFASHLYYKGHVKQHESSEIEKAVTAFRAAYIASAAVHFNAPAWFWHLSTSLIAKRAHRVMTRCEAGAEETVERLLAIAEQNALSIEST